MFKKIRDFIYDINDIFIAIIILAVAAGIIYWRSTSIIAYPQYLSEQNTQNTVDIDFSDIDLTPEDVELNVNPNPEEEGPFARDDGDDIDIDTSDVPVPEGEDNNSDNTQGGDNTAGNQGQENQGGQTTDNAQQTGEVQVTVPLRTTWQAVAQSVADAGLIENTDAVRRDFVLLAANLKLDQRLYPGTYTLRKGMTQEEIIRVLCRAN